LEKGGQLIAKKIRIAQKKKAELEEIDRQKNEQYIQKWDVFR
jgi:hypothetical protein